jgi:hypothetical protein
MRQEFERRSGSPFTVTSSPAVSQWFFHLRVLPSIKKGPGPDRWGSDRGRVGAELGLFLEPEVLRNSGGRRVGRVF